MKRQFSPALLQQADALQQQAASPHHHVWVSANAGTGKTEVLTRRMLALLLADANLSPRSIVALTFTKEVAREMAARLPERIMAWSSLEDGELAARLHPILSQPPTAAQLQRARQLPALVLAEPPLTTTLHGFAQAVLARFPLEAGIDPAFTVLDAREQKILLREAFATALTVDDPLLQQALDDLLATLADSTLEELATTLVNAWPRLRTLLAAHGGVDGVLADLHTVLKLDQLQPWPQLEEHQALLGAWMAALRTSTSSTDATQAARVEALLAAPQEDTWAAAFLTANATPRARLATKAVAEQLAARMEDLHALQATVQAAQAHAHAAETYRLTAALLRWSLAINAAYTALKEARGALDFTDLITKVESLLAGHNGAWVHYRLDRTIRHLLLDEGQDNSPAQNRIFHLLAAELLEAGGEGPPRTVFAVGDVKQSIYRFQGAAPRLFRQLEATMKQADTQRFRDVPMTTSFRTAAQVLQVVDDVFASGDRGKVVLGEDTPWPVHRSVYGGQGGRVELWPLLPEDELPPPPQGWPAPGPEESGHSGPFRLASSIAADICAKVEQGWLMPSHGSALRYDDVLVLAQRNSTAAQLAAGLKQAGLPVKLFYDGGEAPPLVDDLIAWWRMLANPRDHIALAQVLKSPLVGWSDAQLLALHTAAANGLWTPHVRTVDAPTADWLDACHTMVHTTPPHAALAAMVRQREVARRYGLAPDEFAVAISGLLEAALGVPTLTELVAALQEGLPLASGEGHGCIKVMTVHKAKGLEAPLVYLAETTRTPGEGNRDKLVWREDAAGSPTLVAWRPSKAACAEAIGEWMAAEDARTRADSLRSLYVALTRAKDMLVVAGYGPMKDDSWYAHVCAGWGLAAPPAETQIREDAPPHRTTPWQPSPATPQVVGLPPVPPTVARQSSGELTRGTVIHRLLEVLPTLAPSAREPWATAWLQIEVPQVEPATRAAWLAEAQGVITALPQLFAAGHAEVPVWLGATVGRIDRLVQLNGIWWVLDYKTEPQPPATVPAEYRRQVAGYAAALAAWAGEAPLRAAIIWTATATQVEVDVAATTA